MNNLRNISKQELADILNKHDKWIKNEEGGIKADLSGADLSGADLSGADLFKADLSRADLSGADLSGANLYGANLITFQFKQHFAYFTFDGILQIGCEALPVSEWMLMYEEIGKKHNYSKLQIKMYGKFIKQCYEAFKNGEFKQ